MSGPPPDGPQRRTVLSTAMGGAATLAGGLSTLAGCLGNAPTGTGDPPPDATAAVRVADVRPFAPELPVAASVEAVRPWVTPDRTAAVEVSLSNRASRIYELLAGSGDWKVLSDRTSDQRDPGVALWGEDADGVLDPPSPLARVGTPGGTQTSGAGGTTGDPGGRPPDTCWKLTDGTANPLAVKNLTRLDPGETVSTRFEVWGRHENAPGVCLPTGEFAFGDSYTVESRPESAAFEWGFTLSVERPE